AGLGLNVTTTEAPSTVTSSSTVGLDTTTPQAYSTITSSAEINTATSSYTPSLTFSSGTSVGTLSGTYSGTATGLTVKMMANATLSTSTAQTVHFQVLDQSNHTIVDYQGSIKAGDKIYIDDSVGLSVSFSAGTVVNNATATSTVSPST